MRARLNRWPRLADRAIERISRLFNNIGMLGLMLLMTVTTADVLLRIALNRPIRGANEIVEFMMLLVVFLAVALTQYLKSNISVNLLYARFPERIKAILECFLHLLCLGICCLIVWQSIVFQQHLQDVNSLSVILKIPVSPFQLILVIGISLLCLVFLRDFIYAVRKAVTR